MGTGAGLRVLLTNTAVVNYSGSELYAAEVALCLRRRGHQPALYSPRLGRLAEALRAQGLEVVDDLGRLSQAPDVIHGQHHLECMAALAHFAGVPAVYFCHGLMNWVVIPPRHPRLFRYVAVSEAVARWAMDEHAVPAARLSVLLSFVDLARFKPRAPLPLRPARALVFSNQAREENFASVAREACAQTGIRLDVMGLANGNPCSTPEDVLGQYDLVFARGRAALEALAVGAAVVCCDIEGSGPLVTAENLDWLHSRNFGQTILTRPLTAEALAEEIGRYDAADAAQVSARVRASAGLESAVDRIVDLYTQVLEEQRAAAPASPEADAEALARYLRWVSLTAPDLYGARAWQVQVAGAQAARQAAQAQLADVQADYAALQAETARWQQSRSWRLYRRLTQLPLVRALYQAWRRLRLAGGRTTPRRAA